MDEIHTIPPQLRPAAEKLYDDLTAVLTDYKSEVISAEDLYAYILNLHKQISLIIYND